MSGTFGNVAVEAFLGNCWDMNVEGVSASFHRITLYQLSSGIFVGGVQ